MTDGSQIPHRVLAQPLTRRRRAPSWWDTFAVTHVVDSIARAIGTPGFVIWQTVLFLAWVVVNMASPALRWDAYPFILLVLVMSAQAAYSGPLIMLAQNRQDDLGRAATETDRQRAIQAKAATAYLIAEAATLRTALDPAMTRDALRQELDRLASALRQP